MKLLYSGSTLCDETTFKRLILVADEIGFMDRPGVMFKNWGMIGMQSQARQFDASGIPVTLSVHSQPSGMPNSVYGLYAQRDLGTTQFIETFLAGLATDESFASKFIQAKANYGSGTGADVRAALVADTSLAQADLADPGDQTKFFKIDSPDGRRETLKTLLADASIQVTNALVIAESTGLTPVTDDRYFARLLAMRSSSSSYIGEVDRAAVTLGTEISRTVVPDEALQKLTISDLFHYRESAKDAYAAWTVEMNRLGAIIAEIPSADAQKEIPRIIAVEIAPRILQYRNDMKSVRDKLFGDLVKRVATWEIPSLSLAYLANIGFAGAIALFASGLMPAVPALVDYFQRKRDIARRNSMAYLIGLTSAASGDR